MISFIFVILMVTVALAEYKFVCSAVGTFEIYRDEDTKTTIYTVKFIDSDEPFVWTITDEDRERYEAVDREKNNIEIKKI